MTLTLRDAAATVLTILVVSLLVVDTVALWATSTLRHALRAPQTRTVPA